MKIAPLIIAVCMLLSTASSLAGDDGLKEAAWINKGKAAIETKLKDPDSAQFRNTYFNRGSDGVPMTCGEVNSKNSFGGYGGYQKFISGGSPDMSFLEEEVSGFSELWNRFCT